MPEWRNFVCGAMIVILPASLSGQDSARAMLHSDPTTRLNGAAAINSSAIFPNDVIETSHTGIAKIDADGSTVTIQPDTFVQFEGDELVLDHGRLEVTTSRQMHVRVNCMTIIPITSEWSRYEVMDVDGRVTIDAYQNDVRVREPESTVRSSRGKNEDLTVHQGEHSTRDEKCGAALRPAQAVSATGPILNSTAAKLSGIALVGLIACLGFCHEDNPLSPSKPSKP